ncbi:MAG TPA: nitroreductase/quinone reductase family protein [Gaiellaceae bacterium]|jgi:deazaflavin-dependent oxidoreductase (nitroreductase family)
MGSTAEYRRPGWVARKVVNRLVALVARAGIGIFGTRVLEVRGRTSGESRRVPVIVLAFDGHRYLVSARGQTHWVRNLRAAGEGTLLLGRRREPIVAVELPVAECPPILREYLRRWKWEVGRFFEGVGPDSSAGELERIAADHPVFRLEP